MRKLTIFVLSDARSGSTILDQCLGGHPNIVSLGEVHWLPAYAVQDRSRYDPDHPLVCTCGLSVADCPFWSSVAERLHQPLETLQLHAGSNRANRIGSNCRLGSWLSLVGEYCPSLYRIDFLRKIIVGRRLGKDCIALYDAASSVSGRQVCVDSSKSAVRFRDVYAEDPARTRAIILTRDVRAVVHSKMKRGRTLEAAAKGWKRKMLQIESLVGDVPRNDIHVLRYESLCQDPQAELRNVCAFLDLEMSDAMLQRATEGTHHVGGSPSKFDKGRIAIVEDKSYEQGLDRNQVSRIAVLVGSVAKRWGYQSD